MSHPGSLDPGCCSLLSQRIPKHRVQSGADASLGPLWRSTAHYHEQGSGCSADPKCVRKCVCASSPSASVSAPAPLPTCGQRCDTTCPARRRVHSRRCCHAQRPRQPRRRACSAAARGPSVQLPFPHDFICPSDCRCRTLPPSSPSPFRARPASPAFTTVCPLHLGPRVRSTAYTGPVHRQLRSHPTASCAPPT